MFDAIGRLPLGSASTAKSTSDSQSAYMEGLGTEIRGDTPAYLSGYSASTDNLSAFLKGGLDASTDQDAYLYGSGVLADAQSVYLAGRMPVEAISAYLEGEGSWPFSDDWSYAGPGWDPLKWLTETT